MVYFRRCRCLNQEHVQDMCGEDVSFCLDAIELVMRSGVTLVFVWVMKKLVLFEEVVEMAKVKKSLLGTQFIGCSQKKRDKEVVNIPSMQPPVGTIRRKDIGDKDDNRKRDLRVSFLNRYINHGIRIWHV